MPGKRKPIGSREVEQPHRRIGRPRPEDLKADPLDALQRLPPGDERRQHEIAERPVIEKQRTQRVTVDCDIAERLGHERGQEDGLPREEVQLTKKAGRTVPDDLVAGRVENRHLALDDRDKRIRRIPDLEQHLAHARRPLLTQAGKRRHLRGRQRRDGGNCHPVSVAMRCRPPEHGPVRSRRCSHPCSCQLEVVPQRDALLPSAPAATRRVAPWLSADCDTPGLSG